jgi:hypothetical protein
MRAEERLTRVRCDYLDGSLTAAGWEECRPELESERDAAAAQVAALAAAHDALAADAGDADGEEQALAFLADVQSAAAGTLQQTDGTDALRAALVAMFERFTLVLASGDLPGLPGYEFAHDAADSFSVLPDRETQRAAVAKLAGAVLIPTVRTQADGSYRLWDVLDLEVPQGAVNKESISLASDYLFAPVPISL